MIINKKILISFSYQNIKNGKVEFYGIKGKMSPAITLYTGEELDEGAEWSCILRRGISIVLPIPAAGERSQKCALGRCGQYGLVSLGGTWSCSCPGRPAYYFHRFSSCRY